MLSFLQSISILVLKLSMLRTLLCTNTCKMVACLTSSETGTIVLTSSQHLFNGFYWTGNKRFSLGSYLPRHWASNLSVVSASSNSREVFWLPYGHPRWCLRTLVPNFVPVAEVKDGKRIPCSSHQKFLFLHPHSLLASDPRPSSSLWCTKLWQCVPWVSLQFHGPPCSPSCRHSNRWQIPQIYQVCSCVS